MSPLLAFSRPAKRTILSGLVGGGIHSILVGALWIRFGFTSRVVGNEIFLVYTAVGVVTVGAIPTALWYAQRLRSPLLVVTGTFALSAYSNWTTSVAQSPTPTPVGPTAFGWYLLGWVIVLGVALLAGGLERLLRRKRRERRAESTSP